MKLPVRKCYHAAKIGFIFIIVLVILSSFEHWRGSKRAAKAQTSEEDYYEKEILEDETRIIPGLGQGGVAAHLIGEAKKLGEESEKKLAINVYLSDRISYNRTLKDHRNPACERVVYDAELPSASVILIFHNEPYSVVVRTIWSVLNSARRDQEWYKKANYVDRETGRTMRLGYSGQDPLSTFVYLKEIILVDDNSTLPELKGKLSHYVRTRLPPDLIRIVRLPDRVGLTRARLAGARYAAGDVIVFLDAHCEAQRDWLRPLLQRIKDYPHAVVVPIIDVIEASNFYYSVQDPVTFQVGGFTFMGHFTWIDVPEREKKRRGSDIAPTWSPTMAGGLFAINRHYFWEIGAYDEQMAGWGGENLEMSFRVWQCGGTLETIPCSRVGHVFRSFHPYGMPAHTDTHGINTARMAEVWMDDYAELFYLHRPDLRKSPKIGDVTHRRVLREKLKCKSFQWYLDNIYREKFVPVRDVFGYGRFKNPSTGFCLDTLQHEGDAAPLGVYPCHERLEPTQYMALSLKGELRDEERCAEPQYNRGPYVDGKETARRVLMVSCHGKQRGQMWRYLVSHQLQHVESGLCLTGAGGATEPVTITPCTSEPTQIWLIDYSDLNEFKMGYDNAGSEQELRLKRLRGQRRISRSLLSMPEAKRRSRKHKKHSRTPKNKFILKLVRMLNGTEDHLEAEVYCQHRRLYPNNTFVRDLVTVLNAQDIKVINNGRVFEHNRVRTVSPRERVLDQVVEQAPERGDERKPHQSGERAHSQERTDRPSTAPEIMTKKTRTHHKSKRKHKHDKKRRTVKPDQQPESVSVGPSGGGPARGVGAPQKRIIIEDFVEIKPLAPTESPPKKRKHPRRQTTSAAPREVATSAHSESEWDNSLRVDADSPEEVQIGSTEDQDKKQDGSDENWPIQVSYFRHAKKKHAARDRHALMSSDNNQVEEVTEGKSKGPVKLIMRSNLTFDLGDELKRWRQRERAEDDVANLLDDLVIPNITQSEGRSSEHDSYEATTAKPQRDSSGSSESGEDK